MILALTSNATMPQVEELLSKLTQMGFQVVCSKVDTHYQLAIVDGIDKNVQPELFKTLPLVETVTHFNKKLKLVSREFKPTPTIITINNHSIGDGNLTMIAGPCSVESLQQMLDTAQAVSQHGATILRGGAFKPRTSPYDFQGLKETGLQYLQTAARQYGMLSISEIMAVEQVDLVAHYVDIVQIGARNMQNFNLLSQVGRCGKPVLLKRGFAATYNDLLMAAEYILSAGNPNVILCERGIRTFETYTRNTLDIAAVPALRALTHLPIVVDPSHGTGIRNMVIPMALAAAAVQADGIMVEVHPEPDRSISDAQQTISFPMFAEMMTKLSGMQKLLYLS